MLTHPPTHPPDHLRLAHDFGGATSPSSWALRNRMYKIATEAGLTEISPEAVNLMTHAMEVPFSI